MDSRSPERLRFSVSLVTQGSHRSYTLTMPSEVLGRTCFVTTRSEDPKQGFQRVLDADRAQQIADYIDSGFGTIPSSIVLSAQPDAALKAVGAGKTIELADTPKAFLVLDGQHRVYGFSLAKTSLRVPVVIYNGLSRQDETRLFIDMRNIPSPKGGRWGGEQVSGPGANLRHRRAASALRRDGWPSRVALRMPLVPGACQATP
jgi:hypothetical protein